MHTPNWSNILLIAARETRDQLRDRRTLFMIAVLPMLLYPIIGMSLMQMAQFFQMHPARTLFISAEPIPESARLIVEGDLVAGADTPFTGLRVVTQVQPLISPDDVRAKASRLIQRTVYDVVVCLPPGFVERVVAKGQGNSQEPPTDDIWPNEPLVFYSAANDTSRIAYERVSGALDHWRAQLVDPTSQAHRLIEAEVRPLRTLPEDISDPSLRRAAIWSKVLPFVLVIWAMTGAFYPAVDLCAGEKERGTLETLLSSPAERTEIVWGKLITVMLFSVATALLNMASMCLTAGFIVSKTTQAFGAASLSAAGPPPTSSLLWLGVALIPISALFSALSLALAAMARSTKEGQYYLMPLLLTTMPLLMLSFMPSVRLELGTAVIPVTGIVLLLRHLMEGHYAQSLVFLGPVAAVTALCCLFAIRWAVDQFTSEDVLFRESERFGLRSWVRHLVRDRLPLPTVGEAVLCGVLILLIRFFAGLSMPFPTTWHGFAVTTAITLVAFVAAPALIMTIILTSRPTETLLLKKTTLGHLIFTALLALALHPLAVCVLAFVGEVYPIDESALAPLQAVLSQAPGISWLCLVLSGAACCLRRTRVSWLHSFRIAEHGPSLASRPRIFALVRPCSWDAPTECRGHLVRLGTGLLGHSDEEPAAVRAVSHHSQHVRLTFDTVAGLVGGTIRGFTVARTIAGVKSRRGWSALCLWAARGLVGQSLRDENPVLVLPASNRYRRPGRRDEIRTD